MRPRRGALAAWAVAALLAAATGCGRTAALGDLRYYPGATVVGSTSFVGEAFGFPRSAWEQVELRVRAPFEEVRDFYRSAVVSGWTSTFESETTKSGGRFFTRYLADGPRKRFYAMTVEERQVLGDVSILLRRGRAR